MVLFDTTFLSLLLHPGARPPNDSTGNPVTKSKERIDFLIQTLDKDKIKIIIPTPALAELLVLSEPNSPQYLKEIQNKSCFRISDFDLRAAVEASIQIRQVKKDSSREKGADTTWAKVKFDRQILAIAKVENVQTIYSDDKDLVKYGKAIGIEVKGVGDLPLPPEEQSTLFDNDNKEKDSTED